MSGKVKKVKIIHKERFENTPWDIYLTLLYRGREYHKVTTNDNYKVGDIVPVHVYNDRLKGLSFMFLS